MNRPHLICGSHDLIINHPIIWSLPPVSGGVEDVSLNGTSLRDIPWRKYQYVLKWPAMKSDDFEDLEDLVNLNNDFGIAISFQYDLWRNTETPIFVDARLIARDFAAGCYQEVELTLTEQDPREMVS